MSLTTYAQLQSSIDAWLGNRGDIDSEIKDFIALAEARMWMDLRIRAMEARTTDTASAEYLTLPSDFIALRSIKIGGHVLDYMTPERMERTANSDTTGQPKTYSIVGDELQFAPTPDQSYTVELAYFKRLPALSDSNTSNWILTNVPQLYLYGALLEAEPFLENDQRVALWGAQFQASLDKLNLAEQEGRFGHAPVIWGQTSD